VDAEEILEPEVAEVPRIGPVATNPAVLQLERCRHWLEPALEDGFYSWDDVVASLHQGRAMLWPGSNSAIVTEDQTYPTGRVMQVWLAGGDMAEILQMAPGIEAMARLRGCVAVLVEGRDGWTKTLEPLGYKPWSVTLHKAL
jgi:hypothetical protein